jgi:hypothetical protein
VRRRRRPPRGSAAAAAPGAGDSTPPAGRGGSIRRGGTSICGRRLPGPGHGPRGGPPLGKGLSHAIRSPAMMRPPRAAPADAHHRPTPRDDDTPPPTRPCLSRCAAATHAARGHKKFTRQRGSGRLARLAHAGPAPGGRRGSDENRNLQRIPGVVTRRSPPRCAAAAAGPTDTQVLRSTTAALFVSPGACTVDGTESKCPAGGWDTAACVRLSPIKGTAPVSPRMSPRGPLEFEYETQATHGTLRQLARRDDECAVRGRCRRRGRGRLFTG